MSDDVESPGVAWIGIGLFGVIFILIGWDLVADYSDGADWNHLMIEFIVLCVAGTGFGLLWRRFAKAHATLRALTVDLAAARDEAEHWRSESRELLAGLRAAIEAQFSRWQLTSAETEVGLLLLKGLSHKEIANVRGTSERTAREQARALYRKAGLPGRSSLSAFFLEDLFFFEPAA